MEWSLVMCCEFELARRIVLVGAWDCNSPASSSFVRIFIATVEAEDEKELLQIAKQTLELLK